MTAQRYDEFSTDELILRDRLAADRTMLANERTLLSFIRTALTFLLTGLALFKLFESRILWTVGGLFILLAFLLVGMGFIRHRKVAKDLCRLRMAGSSRQG